MNQQTQEQLRDLAERFQAIQTASKGKAGCERFEWAFADRKNKTHSLVSVISGPGLSAYCRHDGKYPMRLADTVILVGPIPRIDCTVERDLAMMLRDSGFFSWRFACDVAVWHKPLQDEPDFIEAWAELGRLAWLDNQLWAKDAWLKGMGKK